jgi:D-tyrosyl-tRNA(Tyr) deacylase
MRAVLQRVARASVDVDGTTIAAIGEGLVVLAGIAVDDADDDMRWLARKIVTLRVFDDDAGTMNRSLADVGGNVLVVSQFTLHASTKAGARPSSSRAAPPDVAAPAFERVDATLEAPLGRPVARGRFGADMAVALVNDGPVTIVLDSHARE